MSLQASELASGKGDKDENFPVATRLIAPQHRAPVLAFYRFARVADDVADNAQASADEKLALLEGMRATLAGERDDNPEALALRRVQDELAITAQHGLDLLEAFRRDVTKLRYADWADLMDYCRYSAAPVGRFVLDVHGEGPAAWPANDALCSALQVINHLQDCGKDYRDLDRVYIPDDAMARAGVAVADLGAAKASPALRGLVRDLAQRTEGLLAEGAGLPFEVADVRLSLETAVIIRLCRHLTRVLADHDPLSERVHHDKLETARIAGAAAVSTALGRLVRRRPPTAARAGVRGA